MSAPNKVPQAIGLILICWMTLSFVDMSAKWLALAGLSAFQLSFMRYAGHFFLAVLFLLKGGKTDLSGLGQHTGLVIFRASMIVGATVLNFIAIQYLPLSLISAIMFFSPVLVSLLAWPLLGERVGPWRWFAILLGFAGVLIVLRPFDEAFSPWMLLPCINSLAFALYSILTRKLSGKVSSDAMQISVGALGTMVLIPFAIWSWQNPTSVMDWAILFGIGFFGWLGHQFFTHAHEFAPASLLMPFFYTFFLYVTLGDFLVFEVRPDQMTLVGAAAIVASGLIIWRRENTAR